MSAELKATLLGYVITLVLGAVVGAVVQAILQPPITNVAWGPNLVKRELQPYKLEGGRTVFGVEAKNVGRRTSTGLVFDIQTGGSRITSIVFDQFPEEPLIISGGKGQDFVKFRPAEPNRLRAGESRVVYIETDGSSEPNVWIRSDTQDAKDAGRERTLASRVWEIISISALLYVAYDLLLKDIIVKRLEKSIEP